MGQVSQLEDAEKRREDTSLEGNGLLPAGTPLTPEGERLLAERKANEEANAMRERLARLGLENEKLKVALEAERQKGSTDRADVKKLRQKVLALRQDLRKAIEGGYMPTFDAMKALGRGPKIPPGRVYQGPAQGKRRGRRAGSSE